jgi:hypothetical protein
MPEKRATEADMVDEYVDIGDEMPTVNYQSVEIEKDALVASSSSGSGSGSSSSSGMYGRANDFITIADSSVSSWSNSLKFLADSDSDSDSDGGDARSPD